MFYILFALTFLGARFQLRYRIKTSFDLCGDKNYTPQVQLFGYWFTARTSLWDNAKFDNRAQAKLMMETYNYHLTHKSPQFVLTHD